MTFAKCGTVPGPMVLYDGLRQRFTLTCGREEWFSDCYACFPRAWTVHIFSYVALAVDFETQRLTKVIVQTRLRGRQ